MLIFLISLRCGLATRKKKAEEVKDELHRHLVVICPHCNASVLIRSSPKMVNSTSKMTRSRIHTTFAILWNVFEIHFTNVRTSLDSKETASL